MSDIVKGKKPGGCPPPPPPRPPRHRPPKDMPVPPPPPPPPVFPGLCCPPTSTLVLNNTVVTSDDGSVEVTPGYYQGKPAYFLRVNPDLVKPNLDGEVPVHIKEEERDGVTYLVVYIDTMAEDQPGIPPVAVGNEKTMFLRGDGTWAPIEIPEQVQANWTEEDSGEPSFIQNKPELATVATTGSYEDLEDKPDIPAAQIQSDWEQRDDEAVDFIKNKPELATVATTGDYADLENKPDIPASQIQSDWTQSDDESADFIKHKPGNFQGATANDNGTSGFVPAPTTADKDKFLCGNGQWSEVDNTRECTSLEMDGWLDAVDNEGNNNG